MELESSAAGRGVGLSTGNCYGVHDALRYGLRSAKDELVAGRHPLELSLANQVAREEAVRMEILQDTMGRSVPLRMQIERSMVSRIQRIPPLESSMIALETLTGMNTRLATEDIFNPPSEALVTVNPHLAMQRKLNIN